MNSIPWFAAALAVVGLVSIVFGIGLLCWGAVQRSARAGADDAAKPSLGQQIAMVFDSLGRLMPNGASKVGGFLVLAGMALIAGAYFLGR